MDEINLILEGVPGNPLVIPSNDIPIGTTSLTLDIRDKSPPVTIVSLPPTLKKLTIGTNLSESLTSIQLPQCLETYIGPIFDDTMLPITLRYFTYIQSFASVNIDRVVIPSGVLEINIVTMSTLVDIDNLNIPRSTHTLNVKGPFNANIDSIDMKNITTLSMPPTFRQPFGKPHSVGEVGNMKNSVPVVSGKEGMDHLMKYLPSLNHLHVILNAEIKDIWEVWTKVLFEGMVSVRSITIDASRVSSHRNVIKDMYRVVDRSFELDKPISRNIHITGLRYEVGYEISYYKLGESLSRTNNISITLSHENPVSNIAPAISRVMEISSNRFDEKIGYIYYSLFGALSTRVYVSNHSCIVIVKGDGPMFRKVKDKTQDIPESSFFPMDEEDDVVKAKPIILYSWTKCGYCQQQETIVDKFKGQSEEDSELFDSLVDIHKVEDPSSIQDDRIKSFPTWVTGESLSPGVKDVDMIRTLLDSNN